VLFSVACAIVDAEDGDHGDGETANRNIKWNCVDEHAAPAMEHLPSWLFLKTNKDNDKVKR
jgi:hypothetical protein